MFLERKPNLSLHNKKGQTAMDISNNKGVLALFKRYLNPPTKKAPSERRGSKDQGEATKIATRQGIRDSDNTQESKKEPEKEQVEWLSGTMHSGRVG